MKKIYFLFSLLFALTWQAATAQAFLVSEAPSNGDWATKTYWYYIKNGNGSGTTASTPYYLIYSSSATDATNTVTVDNEALAPLYLKDVTQTKSTNEDDNLWCVVSDGNGSYSFYNKSAGVDRVLTMIYGTASSSTAADENARAVMALASNYSVASSSNKSVTTTTGGSASGVFKISGSSSYMDYAHIFYLDGTNSSLNRRGSYLAYWDGGKSVYNDWGNSFQFEPADDYTKAYRAAEEAFGNVTTSGVIFGPTQDAYNALSELLTTGKTAEPTSENVSALSEATTKFNESVSALPTTETKVVIGNKLHTNYYVGGYKTSRYWHTAGEDTNWFVNVGTDQDLAYVYTMIPQGNSKFKFYNEYLNAYVGKVPTGNNVEFEFVSSAENAGVYTVENVSGTCYALIYDADCTYTTDNITVNAWHMSAGSGSVGGIVRWETNADASKFLIYANDDVQTAIDNWYSNIITKASHASLGGYTAYGTDEAVQTALATFKSSNKAYDYRVLETAMAAVTATTATTPTAGHYYTITSAQNDAYKIYENYEDTDRPVLAATTSGENLVPALWTFNATGSNDAYGNPLYYISGANSSAKAWTKIVYNEAAQISESDNVPYAIINANTTLSSDDNANDANNRYLSYDNSVSIRYFVGTSTTDKQYDGTLSRAHGDTNVAGWLYSWNETNANVYNNWYVEEVTEIPVKVTSAGYATLYLPFAVTVPTEGSIEVYKEATEQTQDDVLKLTRIAAGETLPAKTPVILVAEGGATENFSIDYNTTTEGTSTYLQGVLAPEAMPTETGYDYYILKNGGSGIGLYKVTTGNNKLSANRAYCKKSSSSTTNALMFDFSGETTGISHAISTSSDAETYYDLQGRRVLYPAHGVFVKSNGEKVYIK